MKLNFHYLKRLFKKERRIAVLDDFFPNLLTGFRVAEYNWYLDRFPKLSVYSTNADFESVHALYAKHYPNYADRVIKFDSSSLTGYSFAYMNFLNNADYFIDALSAHNIPFLMTLYPGGGFALEEPESDEKLDRVINSSLLRGVIATQSVTIDYLKKKNCRVPVHSIYGGGLNPIYFKSLKDNTGRLLGDGAVSICFVADRYMRQGANKGYPEFIETAKLLIKDFPALRFTVVGGFVPEDYPLDEKLCEVISFKGRLFTEELRSFFLTQDIIISPNRPFVLSPGNFDGFPTACCMEASLCGVVVVCSDELMLNRNYKNWEDIVICKPVPTDIACAVGRLVNNRDLLSIIASNGQRLSQRLYDPAFQLGSRADLIENCAAECA